MGVVLHKRLHPDQQGINCHIQQLEQQSDVTWTLTLSVVNPRS